MKKLPRKLDVLEIEKKWQEEWERMGVYHFDWNDAKRPPYTIDTPPPYPSGEFHVGLALNWTYFDILARYKRMKGYNVLFPQGWDCHGLPVEVEVEKKHNIRKTDVPPNQFRKLCRELVNENIVAMRKATARLGLSIDWRTEYKTMDPDYWRRTQLSFILLFNKNLIYSGTHPVNWCPRCETAIADAEVEYRTRKAKLFHVKFKLDDDAFLKIATTRPELIPSCVTVVVNPEDKRYNRYVGKEIHVPKTDRTVRIITDEMADPEFGTGVVMICTYGDKADVKTVLKHKLPVIMSIDEKGKMTGNTGKYSGLDVDQAKKAILQDLREEGLLEKADTISQEVSLCWRCKTPIEILERKQWFMKTRMFTEKVEKNALEITWYPDYMKHRLIDWAKSLEWDWVISRQRIFATPIPIWYCKKCNEIILAEPDWVPIDPRLEDPKIDKCPQCGSEEFRPESDVLDTWFDSSITCAVHAGWPDREDWRSLFPADVHPSGVDIIRTWAYYLLVRHLALFDERPYKSCLINGMVLGADGREMHKSLGNYVTSREVLSKYGADATRQWAAGGGATGSDILFRWPDVEYGWRFLIKLWNASRFVMRSLEGVSINEISESTPQLLDSWILSKTEKLTARVSNALEACQFNSALEETRNFTWHVFCDRYLEAVKDRLYKPEIYGAEKMKAAQYTLYTVLNRILQLLAPIIPHTTEEIYQTMQVNREKLSIHKSSWPKPNEDRIDDEAEKRGDLIVGVITEVRREKAEKHLPLNTPIKQILIYTKERTAAEALIEGKNDIMGTCKAASMKVLSTDDHGREVGSFNVKFTAEY